MQNLISVVLAGAALLLAWPAVWVFLSCLVASIPSRRRPPCSAGPRPSVAVLIPAHNEGPTIRQTLGSALREIRPGDRILVIADNCSDDTTEVATSAGVWVIERNDPEKRGKGFALDFGLAHLSVSPPSIVIVLDADCEMVPGTLDRLACEAAKHKCPVQAVYRLLPPSSPSAWDYVSTLACIMKNVARPAGLARMGLPCLLGGTGMAVPWEQLRTVSLASGNIVEDMQLGLDLAIRGYMPRHCSTACVTSLLPQSAGAAVNQRTRWEHGHLDTILRQVPRLAWAALRQRRPRLLSLAMEVAVPPLAAYTLLLGFWLSICVIMAAVGFCTPPLWITLIAAGLLLMAVALAWARFARDIVPFHAFLAIPFYALSKLSIYVGFLLRRQRGWVRTPR